MAPEILKGNKYSEKCDVWSLGVILYIMLCGYPPFVGDSDEEIMESVKLGKVSMAGSEWNMISAEAKDVVNKMLVLDQKKRYSA